MTLSHMKKIEGRLRRPSCCLWLHVQQHPDTALHGAVPETGVVVHAHDPAARQLLLEGGVLPPAVDVPGQTSEGQDPQDRAYPARTQAAVSAASSQPPPTAQAELVYSAARAFSSG